MARPWRIQFAGAIYHVTARGNRKQDIFFNDHDRRDFLGLLGRAAERYKLHVHAFCLMTNHYHLFLRTTEPNLAAAMKWMNATYTTRFNRRHGLSGHLFQGRYKSVLAADEAHWLNLSIYIHLNPVRAGIADAPDHYEWSSYRDYTRSKTRFDWLCRDEVLSRYGSGAAARRRYRASVDMVSNKSTGFWREFWEGMEEASKEQIKSLAQQDSWAEDTLTDYLNPDREQLDIEEELENIARAFGVGAGELLKRRRNFAPRLAAYYYLVEKRGIRTAEVADLMGVTTGAVSQGIDKFKDALKKDKSLEKIMRVLTD